MFYSTLITRIKEVCSFPDESEATRIISGMRWIGMFSQEKVIPRQGNLLDTLCAQLETLMAYAPGERDLVMLQHKFVVEWADGKQVSSPLLLRRLSTTVAVLVPLHRPFLSLISRPERREC